MRKIKARKLKSELPKLAIGNVKQRFVLQTSLFQSYSSLAKKVLFCFSKQICHFLKKILHNRIGAADFSVLLLCFLNHVMSWSIKLARVVGLTESC